MGDSRVVEIILSERLAGKLSANIRRLLRHSQDRILYSGDLSVEHAKISALLLEQQNQMFSQLKLQRIKGIFGLFWRLIYRLYLDLEQTEYRRFNDWILHRRPKKYPIVTEFQSWFPPARISAYPVLFAILWAILGQMIYHLSRFIRHPIVLIPTSSYIWLVFLAIIVSTASDFGVSADIVIASLVPLMAISIQSGISALQCIPRKSIWRITHIFSNDYPCDHRRI